MASIAFGAMLVPMTQAASASRAAWVPDAFAAEEGDEAAPAVEEPELPISADPARNAEILHIAAALRLSRREDSPGRVELIQRMTQKGALSVEALLDLLEAGRVPKSDPKDGRQVLSDPQRELVLGALGASDRGQVTRAAEQRLANATTVAEARPSALALGAVGGAKELERFLRDWRTAGGRDLPDLEHRDWRKVFQLLLRRSPDAFEVSERYWREASEPRRRAIVEASGELGDPAALRTIASILETDQGDLATLSIGQIPRIGRSYDTALDERMCESLRARLDQPNANLRQLTLQALGELRDRPTMTLCIDLLESEDIGARSIALWSLRRASGVELEGKKSTWMRWFAEQERTLALAPHSILPKLAANDPTVVVQGLRELGLVRIDRPQVARWIEPLLERREPCLRVQACIALSELDDRSSVQALVELVEDPDTRVSAAARAALQKLTGREYGAQKNTAVVGARTPPA
ncbi:MAG: HEAT repeat domain-containing protein [Kofleriaceae bacterium]